MDDIAWRYFSALPLQTAADVEKFVDSVREVPFTRVLLDQPVLAKELMSDFYKLLFGPDLALTHLQLITCLDIEDQSLALSSAITRHSTLRVFDVQLAVDEMSTQEKAGDVAARLLGALTHCLKLEELSIDIDAVSSPSNLDEEVEDVDFDASALRFPGLEKLTLKLSPRVGLTGLSPESLLHQSPSLIHLHYNGQQWEKVPDRATDGFKTKAAKRS